MKREKIKRFFIRLYEKSFDEDIFSSAAQVGFYFMFALFPLLLFLVSLMGLVLESARDMQQELFLYLRQIMPGSALELVQKTLEEVVNGSSGGKLTLGFVIALWSASAGIDSIRIALNAVYKLKETRPWWKRKLASLLLTLGIALLIFIALGIIFYGSQFLSFLLIWAHLPIPSPLVLKILSFIVVAIVLVITFALLYSFCPNHVPFSWNWITPGAIVAIVLWVLFSLGFRLYLHYFNSYAKTYGSLGAIIILMLWLYLTALVILVGGAINAILNEFSIGKFEKMTAAEVKEINKPHGENAVDKDKKKLEKQNPKTGEKNASDSENTSKPENPPPAKKSKLGFAISFAGALFAGLFSKKK